MLLLHRLTLEEFYEAWGAKVKEETAGILTYVKVDDAKFCFPSERKNPGVSWGSNKKLRFSLRTEADMNELIRGYETGCEKLKIRMAELTEEKKSLLSQGKEYEIEERNLEQRISLLYTEYRQAQEIIAHLVSYSRR